MKRIGIATAFAVACLCIASAPALAQAGAELRNPRIAIDYYEPRSAGLLPLHHRLKSRLVLERLSEFLAPVRWPKQLRLMMKECPASGTQQPEVLYSPIEYSLTICYQWLATLRALRPPAAFASRQEVVAGGLVGVVLHASALAMFDMLKIPVLGAQSDAADQLSAYIALQFGDDVARAVIKGTYFVWKDYDRKIVDGHQQYDFASGSSIPRQRMYTVLCIAYGGARAAFKDFVDQGDLLSGRAESCEDEYRQVDFAFRTLVVKAKLVDEAMMSKVRSVAWLDPDDLK